MVGCWCLSWPVDKEPDSKRTHKTRRPHTHIGFYACIAALAGAHLLAAVNNTLLVVRVPVAAILRSLGDTQSHKITQSGLGHHFEAIEILPTKAVSEYVRIGDTHALDPLTTWMIGNSPRSDIHPALDAGFGAIHIPHAQTWSHEHEELISHPRLLNLGTFAELVRHF